MGGSQRQTTQTFFEDSLTDSNAPEGWTLASRLVVGVGKLASMCLISALQAHWEKNMFYYKGNYSCI